MQITESQAAILAALRAALSSARLALVVYRSEWLGYLPFGAYGWVEVDGADVSAAFPSGWAQGDLEALARAGFLHQVSQWRNPEDEFESRVAYELSGLE